MRVELTKEARMEDVEMVRAEARVQMASAEQKVREVKVEKVERGKLNAAIREETWIEKARGEGTLR
mgnify:CR=1 FL=1